MVTTGIPDLHHWRVVSDDEIECIRDGALRILHNAGFRIRCRPILERLEQLGFRVDYAIAPCVPRRNRWPGWKSTARAHAAQIVDEPVLRRPLPAGERVGHNLHLLL